MVLTSYCLTTRVPNKRNASADQLFKELLRSTKLSAQVPEKYERSDNYICENVKPVSNLTAFCSAPNSTTPLAEKVQNSTETPKETNHTSQEPALEKKPTQNSKNPNKLEQIYQALYVAQAQVQLEVKQIQRAQSLAADQQKALEAASMNVKTITGALHTAQQDVATAAMRAQTAQLQLAAHDQLLFAARQKVDALSSQAVGLQAEDSIILPTMAVDMQELLQKLKAPLPESLRPTPIPAMCPEMETKLPNPSASTVPSNQPTLPSKTEQKSIQEILESRFKKPIKKRNSAGYRIQDNPIKENQYLERSSEYDDFFYRWFLRDIRKERRKRRLKEARKKSKRYYDNYYDGID